jgi:hypothetical protein
MMALAATLVGCSHQPPHQVAADSCTDERQFACSNWVAAHQRIESVSFKANPPTEAKIKSEKPTPHRARDKAAADIVAAKAKPASNAAKAEPSAVRIPLPPPSLRMQLEAKSSVAATDSAATRQATVGLAANSGSRTVQEQVAAATSVAERMTVAGLAAVRDDAKAIEGGPPGKADLLVAIVMARPEIRSVSDLAGKIVALDEKYSASSVDVWIAFVAAGALSVQMSTGQTTAINRLVNGEVPAAVLALASADSAAGFPDVAGYKVFQVPLSP